jgi:hypothetical protein
MIYRRNTSTKNQESLRQFALNGSKGIDSTKDITDSDTLLSLENLNVNPDGSLSLRKRLLPLQIVPKTATEEDTKNFKIFKIFNPGEMSSQDCFIAVMDRLRIYGRNADGSVTQYGYDIETTDYYTHESKVTDAVDKLQLDLSNATFFNTATSTVVANCYVNSKTYYSVAENLTHLFYGFDTALYDPTDILKGIWLPRYLVITRNNPNESGYTGYPFRLKIITPEVNTLEPSESGIRLNPNMTLDNPYAIRDVYNNSIPQILGILAYRTTKYTDSNYVYTNEDSYTVSENFESVLTEEFSKESELPQLASDNLKKYVARIAPKKPWGRFLNSIGPLNVSGYVYYQPEVLPNYTRWLRLEIPRYVYSSISNLLIEITLQDYNFKNGWVDNSAKYSFNVYSAGDNIVKTVKDTTVQYDVELKANESDVYQDIATSSYTVVTGIKVDYTLNHYRPNSASSLTVSELTESVKPTSRALSTLKRNSISYPNLHLKAFCKLPKNDNFYATWEYSLDGTSWNPFGRLLLSEYADRIVVKVPKLNESNAYEYATYIPLKAGTAKDFAIYAQDFQRRPDVLPIYFLNKLVTGCNVNLHDLIFKFSIVTARPLEDDSNAQYELNSTVSSYEFTLPVGNSTEFLEIDSPNASLGKKLYYNKVIYSYNIDGQSNYIYASDPDSFITPLYNQIDLNVSSSLKANAVLPWRGKICTFTDTSIHLSDILDSGYTTKTISNSIGTVEADADTVQPTLNGIVFKSGRGVYLAYPNLYSSSDTVFNVTDISLPVQHILNEISSDAKCFAKVLNNVYWLVISDASEGTTTCLRYDFNLRCWSSYKYPKIMHEFSSSGGFPTFLSYNGTKSYEYLIDQDNYNNIIPSLNKKLPDMYLDVIDTSETLPIHYSFDTGQKTDSIAHTKQFVESKIVFATLEEEDSFPLKVYVAIDGDPHVVTKDVTTDAPFWKDSEDYSRGVLNTDFRLGGIETPVSSSFNTLRQLVIRYSGKGKSIRHLIEGDSMYNFKVYEIYSRYKNLKSK